ncbi:hybrid sensor histidine kinase/response regulator transcription factor [Pinibacter soli]|uniref:hybrid sensor histidine kinase/response regulator transcription factor n=1 Tax=Pinibacter soli TaxID=3044211 RepID=UPI00249BCFE8|nr:two-component regulator propeller domain-containing protein [Pinibacter soli]
MKFTIIGREQGLSNSTVLSIYQDQKGFIWLGTVDGLNKYDGHKTIVYQKKPIDSTSISGNYISGIQEDANHDLWVGTSTGLNKFSTTTNKFTRFPFLPENKKSISSFNIECIYKDTKGNIWIGTNAGMNLLEKTGTTFLRFANVYPKPHVNIIKAIYEDKNGIFWVGTEAGLFTFDRQTKKYTPFQDGSNTDLSSMSIAAITENNEGCLFIGTSVSGLFIIDPSRKNTTHYTHNEALPGSISNNVIKCLLHTQKNNIWIGTENGALNLWKKETSTFIRFENNIDNSYSFSQKTASSLFEDRSGNLWVGTHRGGVNLYSPDDNKFAAYTQRRGGLGYKDIKTFFEDSDGKVWIGTDGGGLNIWDRKTDAFTYLRHQANDPSSISSDAVLHIMKDSHHRIWVSTWGGGLNLYTGNGRFKKYLHDDKNPSSISSNNVCRVMEDRKGRIWVGTYYGGLNLFDPAAGTFMRIMSDPAKTTPFIGNNVVSMNEDKNGDLWFGTDDGGLNYFNVQDNKFDHFFNQKKEDGTGGIGNLRVIFVDSKNRLWVGQKGLYLFDYNKRKFNSYTDDPSLAFENIQVINEDNNGIFWITTRNGLIAFNPETKKLQQYNTADGLQGLEFNQNACLKLSDGKMLIGGFNGFNLFDPAKISNSHLDAPVFITDLQIFNKDMGYGVQGSPLKQSITEAKEIVLHHSQSVFSLEYAALDYAPHSETHYSYKLEGFDKNWNYVGNQRKATFTNLDPGTYIFHVRSGTSDGTWSEQQASIQITILPPFWGTWWFELIGMLVIVSIVYFILFYRRKYELKKIDDQKASEMHQMQLQFFTNISHELRTPLSLIAGPLEKMKQEDILPAHKHYYEMMQRNVTRLLSLISELMDFRKVEAGVLRLKVMPGNMHTFVQQITEDFSAIALQKNIDFKVQVPASTKEMWFDHQVVEKIIINLVHNAFKYTNDKGKITVELLHSLENFKPMFENDLLVKSDYHPVANAYLRIADSGRGISKESIRYLFERYYRITQEHLGSGVGLAFVKSLTLLHKGFIHVYSEINKGTEIIVAIPSSKEDYSDDEKWSDKSKEALASLESNHYNTIGQDVYSHATPAAFGQTQIAKTILIVDDNEELRHFMKASFGETYHISIAENGLVGLQKAREEMPDLIISDLMMPELNGIEFCKQLREDIEISHIPFILLTAKDALESRLDGMNGGADHYFTKPVSIELLQITIKNLFLQRQKIKERYSQDYKVEVRELVHSAKDKEFMDRLLELTEQQLENTELNVDFICHNIGMSKTKLYKKVKDITGQTINEFVRAFRLKKAVDIMTHEDVTITEVMFRVGIQSNSYFTNIFKKEFNKTPSQFLQEITNKGQKANL